MISISSTRISTLAAAALAVGTILSGSMASAASVTSDVDLTNALSTTALAGFATSGTSGNADSDMDGLVATGSFDGVADEALTFAAGTTAPGSFTLTQSGDTFFNSWSLTVADGFLLTSLLLQGGPGDTVFDIATGDAGGSTTGSSAGLTFAETSGLTGSIDVTYFNPVGVTPDDPVGDIFESLLIDLSGLDGGGLSFGQTLTFNQDTDNLSISGDIRPMNPVPLPAAGWMLIAALGGIGVMKRRGKA
ncbi:VPLPA-CTERM sorting domain-containing protein [uncultured Roseobacter sp.]|uniref:VPLPA-CTERM sorting domain-containing protein n=1 Tax=uncultured Roseobacter sp. TaxID=114847 RepID=UPI0026185D73|nr:VPLPA-CTERM sorting domain-containing protein [uncultured Roseobacter sp.]